MTEYLTDEERQLLLHLIDAQLTVLIGRELGGNQSTRLRADPPQAGRHRQADQRRNYEVIRLFWILQNFGATMDDH